MVEVTQPTREGWLIALRNTLVRDVLEPLSLGTQADSGAHLDEQCRVSVGLPSKRAFSTKARVIGQCWPQGASADGSTEIFISPVLDSGFDAAHVLLHELIHAAVGCKHKHDRTFAKAARDCGLEGRPTATEPGEELSERLRATLATLPPYPHAKLDRVMAEKPDKNRQLKVYCDNDTCESQADGGFKFRLTRKWIDRYTAPDEDWFSVDCPGCHEPMRVEVPDVRE